MTAEENLEITLIKDPVEAAKAAKLRYVNDQKPGIRRQRQGRGFIYWDAKGVRVQDKDELERIKTLGIPPAWTDIWICPYPNGHIQATGRDAKGRKQYIYHPQWHEIRDQTKFNKMILFGESLPKIRRQTEADLRRQGLPREKVLALVVRLLETTMIRIGNDEYARQNESYGLTTLQDQHVTISGSKLQFEFWGKSGKQHTIYLKDRRLAQIVKRCQDLPGYDLFQYVDEDCNQWAIHSGDVNEYLRSITGEDFTAKDFRTWGGTVLAIRALMQIGPSANQTAAKKAISRAVKEVSAQLGNTVTVCRKYYIHPAVLSSYADETLLPFVAEQQKTMHDDEDRVGLTVEEKIAIEFLRQYAAVV